MSTEQATPGAGASGEHPKFVPPYGVPWETFNNLFDKMHTEGLPQRIDRSYLSKQSGNVQTYLMQALRTFSLIDDAGMPRKELDVLVAAGQERKPQIAQLLREHYPQIVGMGQVNATQGQLEEVWGSTYSQKADTQRKAVRFFLAGCAYAGVPVSKLWKAPRSQSSPRSPRKARNATAKTPLGDEGKPPTQPSDMPSDSYRVKLKGGGRLTVTVEESHFNLSKYRDDRSFVYGLVDAMTDYASTNGQDVVSVQGPPELPIGATGPEENNP